MFLEFFYLLRARGLKVSINEWMSLIEALDMGLANSSLTGFYHLCRSILIKSESDYDKFDTVFAEYFQGIETPEELPEKFWQWLAEDELVRPMDDHGDGDQFERELEELVKKIRKLDLEGFFASNGLDYIDDWKKYREAKSKSEAKLCEDGSIYTLIYSVSLESTTREFIKELKNEYKYHLMKSN